MNQRGYTLVELMVSMSIFASAIAIAAGLFIGMLSVSGQSNATRDVQQNMRNSFEEFFRQSRLAQGFFDSIPTFDEACTSISYTGFGPGSVLNLVLDDPDPTVASTVTGERLIIKNFKGEVIVYEARNLGNRIGFVARNLGNPCGAPATEIVTQLTGPDVTVERLRVKRSTGYNHLRPPALLTMEMTLRSMPNRATDPGFRPALDQQMSSEITVSLRGEFCNYFPEACP